MKDVGIQVLVLSAQNTENQTGAQVNILILILMYGLQHKNKTSVQSCAVKLNPEFAQITCSEIINIIYLNLIVSLNELLKAHLLLQVEAKLFQPTEDAVMMLSLSTLVLSTTICIAADSSELMLMSHLGDA